MRSAQQERSRLPLGGLLIAALAAGIACFGPAFTLAGNSRLVSSSTGPATLRGDVSVRSWQWLENSIRDRENYRRRNREWKFIHSLNRTSQKPVEFEKLPSVEDINSRVFSGIAKQDPIGGRKRYTYFIMFKFADGMERPKGTKDKPGLDDTIKEYIAYFQTRLSGMDITVKQRKDPRNSEQSVIELEYPMPEYGPSTRGQVKRRIHNQATLIEFNLKLPPSAINYVRKKLYLDNRIVRWLCLKHTTRFHHAGEDSELVL